MTDKLYVTVVGENLLDEVYDVFDTVKLVIFNPVKYGRLGNFKLLTFTFDIEEPEVIFTRKRLMNELAERRNLMPMYCHGDWMKLFVFKKFNI